jgi:hypothetical protein
MRKLALLSGAALVSLSAAAFAQAAHPLPTPPAGVVYRYWPQQFVQWLSKDCPWSMIELDVDARGSKPLLHVAATRRADGVRVQYTNMADELALDQRSGEAHMAPMALDGPAAPANGATYQLRFATEAGTPVTWQFVLGSDVSEQGSGLTTVNAPGPVLLYREQGGVAGQGTALRIGNTTFPAEVWDEVSQPPYFVAYHAALSVGVHVVAFVPLATEWRVTGAPAQLSAGSEWSLVSAATGATLHARLAKADASATVVHETGANGGLDIVLEGKEAPDGWELQRVRYMPAGAGSGDHSVSVEIAGTKFEVKAGKQRLASGSVSRTSEGGLVKERWTFAEPKSASKQPVEASVTVTPVH